MAKQIGLDLPTTGLILCGKVTSRRRRKFQSGDKPARWNIELHVLTEAGVHRAERWCDIPAPEDIPAVGASIQLPVELVTFTKKNGVGFRLQWGPANESESF